MCAYFFVTCCIMPWMKKQFLCFLSPSSSFTQFIRVRFTIKCYFGQHSNPCHSETVVESKHWSCPDFSKQTCIRKRPYIRFGTQILLSSLSKNLSVSDFSFLWEIGVWTCFSCIATNMMTLYTIITSNIKFNDTTTVCLTWWSFKLFASFCCIPRVVAGSRMKKIHQN